MYKKILVPLDGREPSECVLEIAGSIASRAGAQIDFIHVGEAAQALATRQDTYLERTAEQMSERWGIKTSYSIIDDERYEPDTKVEIAGAIFQYVCDRDVDLVILARKGKGGIVRAWLSSVSKHMVNWCPVPVVLWRAAGGLPQPGMITAIRRIIVPLDGSNVSEEILPHAVKMAKLLNITLHLIRVVTPAQLQDSALSMEIARNYLDEMLPGLIVQGVQATAKVILAGSVSKAILDFAGAGPEVDSIIAMSTHGRTGIARVLLGSIAEGVLDNATVPLMLYRPANLTES
jgi:nucleotide-binding universal stress UspA family protein